MPDSRVGNSSYAGASRPKIQHTSFFIRTRFIRNFSTQFLRPKKFDKFIQT